MSKQAAIHTAVWAQLAADAKPLPSTGQEVMGTDFLYNETTIRVFLLDVSNRLAADVPPLTFQWATLDVPTCLADQVMTLCGYIATATA
jgi:hypothetical protein